MIGRPTVRASCRGMFASWTISLATKCALDGRLRIGRTLATWMPSSRPCPSSLLMRNGASSEMASRKNTLFWKSYLTYTFYRLQSEGKVLEDEEKGIAAFNTGLVDPTYEADACRLLPSNMEQPWCFRSVLQGGLEDVGQEAGRILRSSSAGCILQEEEDLLSMGTSPKTIRSSTTSTACRGFPGRRASWRTMP